MLSASIWSSTRVMARVFLSYARKDGNGLARLLRSKLAAQGLSLWHDLVDMESGNWWHQIEKMLRCEGLEHLVLVVTPAALASL
jgi:hypothetical protein